MSSQNKEHVDGGHFAKIIEYNLQSQSGNNNLNSKGNIEKLFFGDFNAPVEFFYMPSSEAAFEEAHSGFRIVKNSSKTPYILEVKYISNFKEAHDKACEKYPSITVSGPLYHNDALRKEIIEHNRVAFAKQNEEMLKLYVLDLLSYPISNQFAEKTYEKVVSLINNFKAKGVPPTMVDGYSVTFRNVVDDEVWTLRIHMPQGNALKMADLCRQIITDARANKFYEQKYISVLNSFEN